MSDFDPCECIWNHESAMQRLISLVSSQSDASLCVVLSII